MMPGTETNCAPTKDLSVYRDGLDDYKNGEFFSEYLSALDPNSTVETIVGMLKEVDNLQARSVTVLKNIVGGGRLTIWNDVDGFLWDKDAIFYLQLDKLRDGNAYPSEQVGTYVLVATFDVPA